MKYIILNDAKAATHKFKDGNGAKDWDDVKDFDNVGMIVPEGYVVLDFDTTSDAEIIQRVVFGEALRCRMMQTTRGVHLWFKSPEEGAKNFIKNRLALGVYADRKAGGRNAYVKIKDGGTMRPWIINTALEELDTVPAWLWTVSSPSDKFKFKGMKSGDGRNQELFNYVVYLQSKGKFSRDEIRETIRIINRYVFDEPLDDAEVELICRDEAFKPEEEMAEQIAERKTSGDGFKHNEFADELREQFHFATVNGSVYIYEDGYYVNDVDLIMDKMIEKFPSITMKRRAEVLAYLKIKTKRRPADYKLDPYVVNLKNTRLNVRTGACLPFTPEALDFARIPVTYDPGAYNADVDGALKRIFLNDREVIALFEEMVGACLIKRAIYGKAFILLGNGSNGKSTVLDMLKAFLGEENFTAIPLEKLGEKFATAGLENKYANLGDDIDNATIKNSGTLKRIFDGNSTAAERKGQDAFTLKPYATHIFSANTVPHAYDRTDGFYRRWCIIPFNAKFTPDSPDYDPLLIEKLTTPSALSYLLNLAISGVQRLLTRGAFTEPACVKNLLEQYKVDNSTVLTWLDDCELMDNVDHFLTTPMQEIYLEYCDWCKLSGITKTATTITFYRDLEKFFGFDKKRKQRAGKRYFVTNI